MKKDYKKCRVNFYSGYGGQGAVAEVYNEGGATLARFDIKDLEDKLGKLVRGGQFNFGEKKRKYQYITLK